MFNQEHTSVKTVLLAWATAEGTQGHWEKSTQYSWRNNLLSSSIFILSLEVCTQELEIYFWGVLWQRGLKGQAEVWFRGHPSHF